MMTGSDMECDSISAKTLTASSTDGSSDKGDSSRSSVLQDESYQPSIFVRIFVAEFNIQVSHYIFWRWLFSMATSVYA
jgi:hypothetical protein